MSALGVSGAIALGNTASQLFTNIMNSSENEEQRKFQQQMQREQNYYNSPINQRQMLEQAGYSPAAYLDGTKAEGVGGSTPNVIPYQAPQMEDFYNNTLNAVYARKKMEADIERENADTARTLWDLDVDKQSVVDTLNQRYYESRKAFASATIQEEQAKLLQLYGDKKNQELINNLVAATNKLNEESLSQKNIRSFYDAYSELMRGKNRREQQLLKGQLKVLFATAEELQNRSNLEISQSKLVDKQSEYQGMYNRNYSHFGYSIMESQMKQGFNMEEQINQMSNKLRNEANVLDKENKWYESNMATGILSRIISAGKDIKQIESLSIGDEMKRQMISIRWRDFEDSLTDDELEFFDGFYGNTSY